MPLALLRLSFPYYLPPLPNPAPSCVDLSVDGNAEAGASVYDSVAHGDESAIFGDVNPFKSFPSDILYSYRLFI